MRQFPFFRHYIVYHIWCIWSYFTQLSMLTINTLYTQFCTLNTSCINSHINCPYIVKFGLCKCKTSTQSIGYGEKNNQNCQYCYQTYCFHSHQYWSCWRTLLDIWNYLFSLIVQYHVFTFPCQFEMVLSPD